MKKIFTIFLTALVSTYTFAQHRYPVENVTDYSKIFATSNGSHKVGTRETAPLPCTGSPKLPVILVQFADLSFTSDTLWDDEIEHSDANVNAFFNKFCNGTDPSEDYRYSIGSIGTVKQYFMNQSDSIFQPDFVVIGPVTLSKEYAYYGKDASKYSKDSKISEFYTEAIKGAINLGVDWKQFDNNSDGTIDFVFFIFAGEGQNAYGNMEEDEEHSTLIWPKEQTSTSTVGGYTFGGYGCTNEIYDDLTDGIGTMCHELSHGLGLPDLYDTNYKAFGLDYYDVMDSGNYTLSGRCPCAYSSYERDFMGWQNLETIDISKSQTITIEPIEDGGIGYKIVNPKNINEYFLLENRQPIGFDYYYGYVSNYYKKKFGVINGLIVYHVDYIQTRWTGNTVNTNINKQNFTIVPADGELKSSSIYGYEDEYYNSLIGDLYPGSLNVTSIDSTSFHCWTGNNIPVNITNIVQNDDMSITIDINGGDPDVIDALIDEKRINTDNSAIYDLSGRRIEKPTKGVYIKNGKKYFVK